MKYPLDFEWYFTFSVTTQILRETEKLPPTLLHHHHQTHTYPWPIRSFCSSFKILVITWREKINWREKITTQYLFHPPISQISFPFLRKFWIWLVKVVLLLQMFIIFFFPFVNVSWSNSKKIYFRSLLENEISHFLLVAGKEDILWYNWPSVTEKGMEDQLWL